jgi:DNA polymerase-1
VIVRQSDFDSVVEKLSQRGIRAFDCETTGLSPWLGDRLFSLIIQDESQGYYFNFQEYKDVTGDWVLTREHLKRLKEVFGNPESFWFAHNAKFDMAFLAVEGIKVAGTVHCTEALGRVERNDRFTYTLDALTKEIGRGKDDAVKEAIKKLKLYVEVWDDEKEKNVKIPQFNKVPFEIITKYGLQDAKVTLELGRHQLASLSNWNKLVPSNKPRVQSVIDSEYKITKVFFEMEKYGIKVDTEYSQRAASHEYLRMESMKSDWYKQTGRAFVDSALCLAPCFDKVGELYPRTEKGNPSFAAPVLDDMKSPLALKVLEFRDAQKRCNTYFKNFIKYADKKSVLHANMRQSGTATGRISYSNPNLQNLTKNKEKKFKSEFPIRRAFVPRENHCFVMIDFDQMEYRLMLEYAKQEDVIEQVLAGLDVHEATSKMMSTEAREISREHAKTLNFMLLYGGGVAKLAMALFDTKMPEADLKKAFKAHFFDGHGVSEIGRELGISPEIVANDIKQLEKAKDLRQVYFQKLPKIREFTSSVIEIAKSRGYIVNCAGRISHFKDPDFAFKAPNYLIQGGCADIMKKAMLQIHERLDGMKSKMLVQIHDELLFEIHESELAIVPELRMIMESVYSYKKLPLTCGVDHSWTSWADKTEGLPSCRP